jgi:hypothetical protein
MASAATDSPVLNKCVNFREAVIPDSSTALVKGGEGEPFSLQPLANRKKLAAIDHSPGNQ